MIQAVIRGLLQYEKHETQYVSKHIGVFGRVKNYYGMVECTTRGCLHWHCLVWIWGAQQLGRRLQSSPDLKTNVESYLDLIISQSLDETKPFVALPRGYQKHQTEFLDYCTDCYPRRASRVAHRLKRAKRGKGKPPAKPPPKPPAKPPARVRRHSTSGRTLDPRTCCLKPSDPWVTTPCLSDTPAWNRDQARLATKCQLHVHTACCYKYTKAGLLRICRFNFNGNVGKQFHRTTHWKDGMLHGRRPDDSHSHQPDKNRWLNPFNPVILGATRCNHDVKFIPSFSDSLALMFYITVPSTSQLFSCSRRAVYINTCLATIHRHKAAVATTNRDCMIV